MKVIAALQGMLTPLGGAQSSAVKVADGIGEIVEKEVAGFAIDSREVQHDEIFFALAPVDYARHGFNGTFVDSHQFVADAFARGALMAVVRAESVGQFDKLRQFSDRLCVVDDVIEALQQLAHNVLRKWARPVVAITGSAGKTTTKNLTAHVLEVSTGVRVLKSIKNYNNELGLPLSMLQLETAGAKPADFAFAVLEMGMSTQNEIARLVKIAPPDVAVELLVAPVHVEYVGGIENIAKAKAQLVEGLKPEGIAILNADDARVLKMSSLHAGRVLTFGIENKADVTATEIDMTQLGLTRFTLHTPHGEARAELPLPGRHNLMNALATAAVASSFDVASEKIAHALSSAKPSQMRGEILRFTAGFTVIDDTYNSNPRSLVQIAHAAASAKCGAKSGDKDYKRVLIIAGEMRELGVESLALHREAGREIARLDVDILWGVVGHAAAIITGAQEINNHLTTKFFATVEDAAESLTKELRAGDVVLIKGSRGVHMETIIKRLREREEMRKTGDRRQETE